MKESKNTVRNLSLAVVAMFGFGFLLVPIYDVFCEITGLNGKIKGPSTLTEAALKEEDRREVLIQFVTHNNESMPWIFRSNTTQIRSRLFVVLQ
jgi:cytochrome c oxidase assembly protein subunit 11